MLAIRQSFIYLFIRFFFFSTVSVVCVCVEQKSIDGTTHDRYQLAISIQMFGSFGQTNENKKETKT